jgi:hypothetical protein
MKQLLDSFHLCLWSITVVLFYNLKCWQSVFPIVANLAHTLQDRGVPTHQILCFPGLHCDALRPVKSDAPNCPWGCNQLTGYLFKHNLPFTFTDEFGDQELIDRATRMAEVLSQETNPAYDGILLDEVIKASLGRYLRCLYDPDNLEHQHVRQEFIRDALVWIETQKRILAHFEPKAIVIWGGMFYAERIAAIIARRFGIRVIAIENTAFHDRIYVDPTGVTGNRHAAAHAWHWLEACALTPAQHHDLHEYLTAVHSGAVSSMPHPQPASREELCQKLGISQEKRLVLLIGQVAIDSVVLMDSPIFPDMRDLITTTAEILARHTEYQLVVRLHPAEEMWHDNLTLRRLQDWTPPENCSIVHSQQLNTYDLMRESDLGITLCSQAGLEMLSMGKPVITAGHAFYSHKGLTYDVSHRAAYPAVLEEALRAPQLSESQHENVDKLLYHLIFEQLVPFDREQLCVTEEAADHLVTDGAFSSFACARS